MMALFRIVEPSSGTIFIDGLDITEMGLFDLRSRLALVPQARPNPQDLQLERSAKIMTQMPTASPCKSNASVICFLRSMLADCLLMGWRTVCVSYFLLKEPALLKN